MWAIKLRDSVRIESYGIGSKSGCELWVDIKWMVIKKSLGGKIYSGFGCLYYFFL